MTSLTPISSTPGPEAANPVPAVAGTGSAYEHGRSAQGHRNKSWLGSIFD